jgi:hypothetical protein
MDQNKENRDILYKKINIFTQNLHKLHGWMIEQDDFV